MTHPHQWFRLSIDVDPALNPIGISYCVWVADRVAAIHVLPLPGPFDYLSEVLEELLDDVQTRYGAAQELPFDSL